MLTLFKHQQQALEETANKNKVAYYHDMGLGKTFTGAEKMHKLGKKINLVICQKSKIDDWVEHLKTYYSSKVFNLRFAKQSDEFYGLACGEKYTIFGIINYDMAWRCRELLDLTNFTLMLDESSLIQNEKAKRSKFIMKLNFENLILLSGTPTGGKYEKLWSQLHLLGYPLARKNFYNLYVNYHYEDINGVPIMKIEGYKNVERLKNKMRELGCHFLKTEEVFDLPEQIHNKIRISTAKEYRKFRKNCICEIEGVELVGNTTLTKMLYERQLCGQYNNEKLQAFRELLESTDDRLIVFYNFNCEFEKLKDIAVNEFGRKISIVNGTSRNLEAYENDCNSVTFIQYQAGSMGLNLQKANKIIYFTLPLSSELFEQSKKRIHRIGQNKSCFYYYLICKNSIEEKIYKTLEMRKDYTEALFERGD